MKFIKVASFLFIGLIFVLLSVNYWPEKNKTSNEKALNSFKGFCDEYDYNYMDFVGPIYMKTSKVESFKWIRLIQSDTIGWEYQINQGGPTTILIGRNPAWLYYREHRTIPKK